MADPEGRHRPDHKRVVAEICSLPIKQSQGIATTTTVNYTTLIKTIVATIAARPLRIGAMCANLGHVHVTKHAKSSTRSARRNLQRANAGVNEGAAYGARTTRPTYIALHIIINESSARALCDPTESSKHTARRTIRAHARAHHVTNDMP